MGELLDRSLQKDMLNILAESYPNFVDVPRTFAHISENVVRVNLCYLGEHGLVDVRTAQALNAPLAVLRAAITASGLDFLQDDGGLGAVLGVVTVKFHDETIKTLLADRVRAEVHDPTVRDRLLDTIKGLPADATKNIAEKVIEYGVGIVGAGMLQTWIGG